MSLDQAFQIVMPEYTFAAALRIVDKAAIKRNRVHRFI